MVNMKSSCFICFIIISAVIFSVFIGSVCSVSLIVKAGTKRCFLDGAKKDIPVKGEYTVSKNDRYNVRLTVSELS